VKYQVLFQGTARLGPGGAGSGSTEELERHLDDVMKELVELHVEDAAVSATLAKSEVEISVTVAAAGLEDALAQGSDLVRTAIRTAGGFTPAWSIHWRSVKTGEVQPDSSSANLASAAGRG